METKQLCCKNGPFIANGSADNLWALDCPRCGYNYLHHGTVTIYNRGEDKKNTLVIRCDGGAVSKLLAPSTAARNRNGLAIQFYCEGCGDDIELTIQQHKGQTLLHWRFEPSSSQPAS
jgi:hypothetical protein